MTPALPGSFVPRPGAWQTASGRAEILADADRPGAYLLVVDDVPQSYVDLLAPAFLEFAYVRQLGTLVELLEPRAPAPLSVVHVGAGAATLARHVTAVRPGSHQTVIEYDRELADGVEERLGSAGFRYTIADGRKHLAGLAEGATDLLVTDAFVANRIPPSLTTSEYLGEVRRVLRGTGWYAVNVADAAPFAYARRVVATVAATFASSVVLIEPAVLRGRRFGNLVVVGSDAELPLPELLRAASADAASPHRVVHGTAVTEFVGDAAPLRDADALESPIPPLGAFSITGATERVLADRDEPEHPGPTVWQPRQHDD